MERTVAIITGGAHGLGRAMCLELAHEHHIVVADLDLPGAEVVVETIKAGGGSAEAVTCDVRSASDIVNVMDRAKAAGRLHVLVNNAGIYPDNTFIDMPEDVWDQVIGTNLKGTFLCSQAFVKRLPDTDADAAIVNLVSTAGFSARVGASHYSASKAGVAMLTKSMAQELGPRGIRVNAVAPGLIFLEERPVNPNYAKSYTPMIPTGRVGLPSEVASAVAFLVSKAASYVNGVIVPVDGGFLTGRALVRPSAGRTEGAVVEEPSA